LGDFEEKRVQLEEQGYRVGVSPDGKFAAISQDSSFALVDLQTAVILDSQEETLNIDPSNYGENWGDIVLDKNNIAHYVPNNILTDNLYSINFEDNLELKGARSYVANLRIHPTGDRIYAAWRGIIPGNIASFSTETFPVSKIDESDYNTIENISYNLWLSEDGENILIRNGLIFEANEDPDQDLEYVTALSENPKLSWADHSSESGEWIGAQYTDISLVDREVPFQDKIYYINDANFTIEKTVDVADITTSFGRFKAGAPYVFHSPDGTKIYTVLRSDSLVDNFAIQIINND